MNVVAVVQARMGSTRLPGKVMLPLGGRYVLEHVVSRVSRAAEVDNVVVATSDKKQDDIIARFVPDFGAKLYRGSESNVLDRMFCAAEEADADIVVRITADCPLLDPNVVSATVETLHQTGADYASNIEDRTFPRGFDVEAFTFDSFEQVHSEATAPHHREHVTPYYHENPDTFALETVTSEMVYEKPRLRDRTDLRLTLDEAADYELFHRLYTESTFEEILSTNKAIRYLDEHDLSRINSHIEQKKADDASGD